MPSLSDRLQSLGVKVGARDLPFPSSRRQHSIERVMSGHFENTPYGDAFVVATRYPVDQPHGRCSLRLTDPLRTVAAWSGEPRLAQTRTSQIAFLDTETTGLAGGTGTYAFMVGVARYEGDTLHLAQFFMRDPAEEMALLTALTRFLVPCEALVTFNGKGFDVPLLNARYVLCGDTSPLPPMAHLDLLLLARRLWRERLASRALGSLEQHILDVHRTQEDVPGWEIPGLYFDYLRSGDARQLRNVFYHNAIDVLSLAALLSHMAQLLNDPLNEDVHPLDRVAIGKLYESLGQVDDAIHLFERALVRDLPGDARRKTVQHLSFVHKRRGDLAAAAELWRQEACSGEIYAHVELAKICEHKQRDYGGALRWTQAAIDLVTAPDMPWSTRDRWLAELEHRLARLRRRMARYGK